MYVIAMAAVLVTMALALARARLGPTVFDRILALNMFGTKTVLLIAVIGFLTDRPEFLDVGVLYALMNFIGMVALLRFSKYGHFDDSPGEGRRSERGRTGRERRTGCRGGR